MTTDFARKALALHNKYRAHHKSLPLEWCQELQKKAQAHATSLLVTGVGKGGVNVGQNVFQLLNKKTEDGLEPVDDQTALERAIDSWYESLKYHDPTNPSPKSRSFLQMASPNTTKLGVGIARKVTATSLNIIVVAFYDTAVPNCDKPSESKIKIVPTASPKSPPTDPRSPQPMSPGTSVPSNILMGRIMPQTHQAQRPTDSTTLTIQNFAQNQQRLAQNEARQISTMNQRPGGTQTQMQAQALASTASTPLQESSQMGQRMEASKKSGFQMQVVQSVQMKGATQKIDTGGAESRFLALAAQTSQFTQPQVINIGFQDGKDPNRMVNTGNNFRGQQQQQQQKLVSSSSSSSSKENQMMGGQRSMGAGGMNHAEMEESVSWSQQSTSRMTKQSKTSSAQLHQERVTYQSLM